MSRNTAFRSYSTAFHGLSDGKRYIPATKLDAVATVYLLKEYHPRSPRIASLRTKWKITESDIEILQRKTHSLPPIEIEFGSSAGKSCWHAGHPWTKNKQGWGDTPQKALAAWDQKLSKAERRAFAGFVKDVEMLKKEFQGAAAKQKR